MEEDWGSMSAAANKPTFSLFYKVSPEEAAKKDSFVDIIVYNRWSKAERRLYQRLKAEHIAKRIEQEQMSSIDEITNSLDQLALFRSSSDQLDPQIDSLIDTLNDMKLKHDKSATKKPV